MTRSFSELVVKDPSADEPYEIDWSAALAALETDFGATFSGYTVQDSQWTVSGPNGSLTVHNASILAGNTVRVYVTGGTLGSQYRVTNTMTAFNAGLDPPPQVIDRRSFTILVQQR